MISLLFWKCTGRKWQHWGALATAPVCSTRAFRGYVSVQWVVADALERRCTRRTVSHTAWGLSSIGKNPKIIYLNYDTNRLLFVLSLPLYVFNIRKNESEVKIIKNDFLEFVINTLCTLSPPCLSNK